MKNYNYKCVISKNGNKMFYKSVGSKWKRISNKLGEKAEKGKMKYRVASSSGQSNPPTGFGDLDMDSMGIIAGHLDKDSVKNLREVNKKTRIAIDQIKEPHDLVTRYIHALDDVYTVCKKCGRQWRGVYLSLIHI